MRHLYVKYRHFRLCSTLSKWIMRTSVLSYVGSSALKVISISFAFNLLCFDLVRNCIRSNLTNLVVSQCRIFSLSEVILSPATRKSLRWSKLFLNFAASRSEWQNVKRFLLLLVNCEKITVLELTAPCGARNNTVARALR